MNTPDEYAFCIWCRGLLEGNEKLFCLHCEIVLTKDLLDSMEAEQKAKS